MDAFTVEHFREYASRMVFDDGERHPPEDWQLEVAADLFKGFRETWLIVPEGNGKSTFLAQFALYGADFSQSPWIPVGAASAKQARIIFQQAEGFIDRSDEQLPLKERFRAFGGYLRIVSRVNGGQGIEVFAAEKKTGDGVIPYPYAIVDELHRHDDLGLYSLWKGKLRKRGGQIITISTAGEPETPFEHTRDEIRRRATKRDRNGAHLRAEGPGLILHEWMVPSDELCTDMAAVKEANPLANITEASLGEDFLSPTMDLGLWKRLKCNRPTRASISAITDQEWDDAQVDEEIPLGASVAVGIDVAFKWDTTALVPLYQGPKYRLLGPASVLVPPRDGTSLHPDEIKGAFLALMESYRVETVVIDIGHQAQEIAHWIEDECGVQVIERDHSRMTAHVEDYAAFTNGLREGTLKHTGDHDLRSHVLHAIAHRLPGGDYRFRRPTESRGNAREQDRRVIDALSAAAMVVQHSTRQPAKRSVYDDYYATA